MNHANSIKMLEDAVKRMETWMTDCDPLLVPYDSVSFDTEKTVEAIAEKLGVRVDVDQVLSHFQDKKTKIIHYNKGVKDRHKSEMDEATSRLFLETFHDFYERYFPEALAAEHAKA